MHPSDAPHKAKQRLGVLDFGDCPHIGKDLSNSILNDCM